MTAHSPPAPSARICDWAYSCMSRDHYRVFGEVELSEDGVRDKLDATARPILLMGSGITFDLLNPEVMELPDAIWFSAQIRTNQWGIECSTKQNPIVRVQFEIQNGGIVTTDGYLKRCLWINFDDWTKWSSAR